MATKKGLFFKRPFLFFDYSKNELRNVLTIELTILTSIIIINRLQLVCFKKGLNKREE